MDAINAYLCFKLAHAILLCASDKAAQELRKKGVAAASKKASRRAAEGLVGIATAPEAAAVVEINSETDFVARNAQFHQLVSSAAAAALRLDGVPNGDIPLAALESAAVDGGSSVAEAVAEVAGGVRENIQLRRGLRMAVPDGRSGVIGHYLHGAAAPGLGRIASLVLLESSSTGDLGKPVQELAHKLAMHVVGALPKYLDSGSVPASALDAERALLREQAQRSGKPDAIIAKMVEGRLRKFYEEVCLLEQKFILDDSSTVAQVVAETGKAAGVDLKLTAFARMQVGEGIEDEGKKDFAAEVAETLKAVA